MTIAAIQSIVILSKDKLQLNFKRRLYMNINELYSSGSDYLKAENLPRGIEVPVTIASYEIVELDGKKKMALRFSGKEKGLVLNKTNAMTISHVYGPDSDDWIGKKIFIYSTKVDYAGQMVDAIRARVALAATNEEDIPGF